jgi:hypothetical protein
MIDDFSQVVLVVYHSITDDRTLFLTLLQNFSCKYLILI